MSAVPDSCSCNALSGKKYHDISSTVMVASVDGRDDKILILLGRIRIKLLSTENEIMMNEVISQSVFMFWVVECLGTAVKK